MIRAFGDPNALIGVVALILALAVPFLYRRRRRMLYRIEYNGPLLDYAEKKEHWTATIRGQQWNACDLWLYIISVNNFDGSLLGGWGGTDVAPSDFHRPLSFDYGNNSWVVHQEVVDESPQGMGVNLGGEFQSTTVVEPLLLNQGDSFSFRVIVARPSLERRWWGEEGTVRANGRIQGIKGIRCAPRAPDFLIRGSRSLSLGMLLLLTVDFVLPYLLGYPIMPDYSETKYHVPFSIAFGFAAALGMSGLLSNAIAVWLQRDERNLRDKARIAYRVSKPAASGVDE